MEKRKPTEEELAGLRALAQAHLDVDAAIEDTRANFQTGNLDVFIYVKTSLQQIKTHMETAMDWIGELHRLLHLGCELDIKLEGSFITGLPKSLPIQRCCQ